MKPIPCTNTGETIIFNEANCLHSSSLLGIFTNSVKRFRISSLETDANTCSASDIDNRRPLLKMCTHEHIGIKLYQADGEVQWENEPCLSVLLQYKSLFFVTWAQTFPCLLLHDAWTDYRPNFYNHLSTTVLRHFGSLFFSRLKELFSWLQHSLRHIYNSSTNLSCIIMLTGDLK